MSWTPQRKIRLGFWLMTAATLVLGFVAFRNAVELVGAAEDLARTNDLVKELQQLLSGLKDVEVAQREYIITGEERYVDQIVSSRTLVREGVQSLANMHADQRWLELLRTAIPQKFDEIDTTVKSRRAAGIEAASQVILTNRGHQAMDDIRKIVETMILEENRLLTERSTAQRNRFMVMMNLFGVILVVTLLLIWSVFYLINYESHRARLVNADLERRVAMRTEELQRSNEDLQQFAYVASHDLKEPMRMISSYSTLLQRRYTGRLDPDADMQIGFIVEGVRRMNRLITDLLEYSRAGQTQGEEFVPVQPEAVLSGVLDNLKVAIADAGAKVTHDNLPEVVYDPMRLGLLLQNLISNGIKYRSERSPRIHVSATRRGNETVFSVRDNGIGIDPEHQDQIFGIFKRLHGKEIDGTGIGLAMCKKITERNGGRIWVESQPGRGSTFYFTVLDAASARRAGT